MKTYFIKPGYEINPVAITREQASGSLYWEAGRIKASRVYQFSVYQDAIKIAREYNVRSLCDVGCGTGEKLRYVHAAMPDLEIIGIDQNHAIEYCRKRHNFGKWLVDDFAHPKITLQADMTLCSDVIEHLIDPDILLLYLKRITKPGGPILISTPDRDVLRGANCTNSPNKMHIREWNAKEFRSYLESHSFSVLKHFHAPAVKYSFTRFFWNEVVIRILSGKSSKYNQIILLRAG